MPERPLTREAVLALLAAAPKRLAALTADLAPAQLRASPAPGVWSASEVLAHLRACADMWGDSIAKIIAEDEPAIRAINPRTWINQTNYLDLAYVPSFSAFAAQRAGLLALLEPLPPASWSRAATVTGAGRPLRRTVLDYANRLARHERPHISQIERIAQALRG